MTQKTCTEMVDVIAEVPLQTLSDFFAKAKYVSLTDDGSEAWKTVEKKELVHGKVFLKGYHGFLPGTFFLACRSLKVFG